MVAHPDLRPAHRDVSLPAIRLARLHSERGEGVTMFDAIRNQWLRLPKWGRLLLIVVAVIFAPPILTSLERLTGWALLTQVNRALIYVCLALGLNIVVGFAGLLDLGYAAFFAIGAYAFGVMTWPNLRIEASFFIALWICAAVASVFGMLIGAPT